ncbi:MAG: hypothetical protein SGI71_12595 [Verrucomicrobiota bacterium]|nr:hypothetical protein [Verrucomicrobiota bacterium]
MDFNDDDDRDFLKSPGKSVDPTKVSTKNKSALAQLSKNNNVTSAALASSDSSSVKRGEWEQTYISSTGGGLSKPKETLTNFEKKTEKLLITKETYVESPASVGAATDTTKITATVNDGQKMTLSDAKNTFDEIIKWVENKPQTKRNSPGGSRAETSADATLAGTSLYHGGGERYRLKSFNEWKADYLKSGGKIDPDESNSDKAL